MNESHMLSIECIGSRLRIPTEIYVAWGQPVRLYVQKEEAEIRVLLPDLGGWRSRARRWSGRAGKRIEVLAVDHDDEVVEFGDIPSGVLEGSYRPANYHPRYQLVMVNDYQLDDRIAGSYSNLAAVNTRTWRSIENYHEHRDFERQDAESHQISKHLVESIQANFPNPSTILELGCGAGRNLLHLGRAFPNARVMGVDINAAGSSRTGFTNNVSIEQGDVLSLDWARGREFDVIITCGFLMHINHEDVNGLVDVIHAVSKFHAHFELHGPGFGWDFHRYPRSYRQLMVDRGIEVGGYEIYVNDPILSYGLTPAFSHALIWSIRNE